MTELLPGSSAQAAIVFAETGELFGLVFVIDLKRTRRLETKAVNIWCWCRNIRSQWVHVPLSLTDTCQLYQYDRERV